MATKTLRLEVLHEDVLLKVVEGAKKTEGGILLPDSVVEGGKYEVVDVGSAIDVIGAGETVFLKADFKGTEIEFNKEKYLVVGIDQVAAVVKEG